MDTSQNSIPPTDSISAERCSIGVQCVPALEIEFEEQARLIQILELELKYYRILIWNIKMNSNDTSVNRNEHNETRRSTQVKNDYMEMSEKIQMNSDYLQKQLQETMNLYNNMASEDQQVLTNDKKEKKKKKAERKKFNCLAKRQDNWRSLLRIIIEYKLQRNQLRMLERELDELNSALVWHVPQWYELEYSERVNMLYAMRIEQMEEQELEEQSITLDRIIGNNLVDQQRIEQLEMTLREAENYIQTNNITELKELVIQLNSANRILIIQNAKLNRILKCRERRREASNAEMDLYDKNEVDDKIMNDKQVAMYQVKNIVKPDEEERTKTLEQYKLSMSFEIVSEKTNQESNQAEITSKKKKKKKKKQNKCKNNIQNKSSSNEESSSELRLENYSHMEDILFKEYGEQVEVLQRNISDKEICNSLKDSNMKTAFEQQIRMALNRERKLVLERTLNKRYCMKIKSLEKELNDVHRERSLTGKCRECILLRSKLYDIEESNYNMYMYLRMIRNNIVCRTHNTDVQEDLLKFLEKLFKLKLKRHIMSFPSKSLFPWFPRDLKFEEILTQASESSESEADNK